MKRLIEFPLDETSSAMILVEIDDAEGGTGPRRAGRLADTVGKAEQTFEDALKRVRPAADAMLRSLRGLAESPDEVSVEFGVKLSASAGVVLASGSVEANYVVTLKWIRADSSSPSTSTGLA